MSNQVSPQTPIQLRDRLFHASADFRINSVDIVPRNEAVDAQDATGVEQKVDRPEDAAEKVKAVDMQEWWVEGYNKSMGIDDGYNKVAVLLIKWEDNLDELKTAAETKELCDLFADRFHYNCNIVELNVSSKPQLQMNSHISSFLQRNDGPDNLMIVYYTGHGLYREREKFLELTASEDPANPTKKSKGLQIDARVNWDKAEEQLKSDDVDGDVLTIMDTCYASNVQKSGKEDTRTFELLSACTYDTTTASPGPYSFTRALIDSLKELQNDYGDRSFTTFHLNQRICQTPNRRDTPSQLWYRLKHHESHIRLAPLKREKDRLRAPSFEKPPQGYLTLRLALRDSFLNRQQIEFLARQLVLAFNKKKLLGVRKIDWLGLKPARSANFGPTARAMLVIARWKEAVQKKRDERTRLAKVGIPAETSVESTTSSPTRKRARDADENLPDAKKGPLVITTKLDSPPSPPVSDSSRVDELDGE